MGNLESSVWSGTLGRSSSRANVTSSNSEAVSSPANGTSEKSRGGLLAGQCDFKEVLGGARKHLGAVCDPLGEVVPHQQGALCGIAVHIGHQVGLEWGDVHLLGNLCKRISIMS